MAKIPPIQQKSDFLAKMITQHEPSHKLMIVKYREHKGFWLYCNETTQLSKHLGIQFGKEWEVVVNALLADHVIKKLTELPKHPGNVNDHHGDNTITITEAWGLTERGVTEATRLSDIRKQKKQVLKIKKLKAEIAELEKRAGG